MTHRLHEIALSIAALLLGTSIATAGERIVAAGAAATEILWDIGAAEEIVGVDATSSHPPEALASKPNVGYFRRLSAEGLLSLGPTLVVAVGGAGPREVLDLVARSGVRVETIDDDWTEAGVADRIDRIGAVVGRQARAHDLSERVRAEFADLARARGAMAVHPRVLFVLTLTNGRPLVAGHGTAADAMIGLAGGTNVATGFDGYKAMTDEAIVAAAPEVVVSMRDGPGNLTADDVFQSPAFSTTPAALRRRFVALDGAGLLAFGPRTPSIARELMERLSR